MSHLADTDLNSVYGMSLALLSTEVPDKEVFTMKDQRYLWNPLRVVSSKLDKEVVNFGDLYKTQVSESDAPEENLVVMISKLIHVTKMLASCTRSDDVSSIESCERLVEEVKRHERLATAGLVDQSSKIGISAFKIVVRFPSRMERIGIMFRNILDCYRIKITEGMSFNDEALGELSELFGLVLDTLKNLRDVLLIPNRFLLEHIKVQTQQLAELVEFARLANWGRLEAGDCPPLTSSVYVEILDCFKQINEYLGKMRESLVALANLEPEADEHATEE